MSNVCSLPPRDDLAFAGDPQMQAVLHALGAALENSPEFIQFTRSAEAVNTDGDVYALMQEIRSRRASFSLAESGELEARLQALPVMTAYRAAEQALKELFAGVEALISQAAGLGFCEHVRPEGHG